MSASSYETIEYEKNGPLATLTINRPDRMNAMTNRMLLETGQARNLIGSHHTSGRSGEDRTNRLAGGETSRNDSARRLHDMQARIGKFAVDRLLEISEIVPHLGSEVRVHDNR